MRLFFLLPIFLFACTGNQNQSENNSAPEKTSKGEPRETDKITNNSRPAEPLPTAEENCYWQILKRDTFVASFRSIGDRVSGKLTFDNFEKDGSTGAVSGNTTGGILKLWYNFQSEGLNSVLEVWFKKDGDKLLRGVGEMAMKGDTTYFSKPISVKFGGSHDMEKVSCAEVPLKYR